MHAVRIETTASLEYIRGIMLTAGLAGVGQYPSCEDVRGFSWMILPSLLAEKACKALKAEGLPVNLRGADLPDAPTASEDVETRTLPDMPRLVALVAENGPEFTGYVDDGVGPSLAAVGVLLRRLDDLEKAAERVRVLCRESAPTRTLTTSESRRATAWTLDPMAVLAALDTKED